MRFPSRLPKIAIVSAIAVIFCIGCLLLSSDLFSNQQEDSSKTGNELAQQLEARNFALQLWRDQFVETKSIQQLKSIIVATEAEPSWASSTALDEVVANNRFPVAVRLLAAESIARAAVKKDDYPGLQKAAKGRHRQLRLSASDALVRCGHKNLGFDALLREAYSKSSRQAALFRLRRLTGQNFRLDAKARPAAAHKQIQIWKQWIDEQGDSFKPRAFNSLTNSSNS